MNMSSEVRVKTDRKYKNLYNELKNLAFGDMHEIFFLCACLGFSADKKKEIGRDGDDRFWSRTITPEEYTCYYAMILARSDLDFNTIKDDKIVIQKVEEYANAGMQILIDDFLEDYLIEVDGEYKLDKSSAKELPKSLLHFIYERIEEVV